MGGTAAAAGWVADGSRGGGLGACVSRVVLAGQPQVVARCSCTPKVHDTTQHGVIEQRQLRALPARGHSTHRPCGPRLLLQCWGCSLLPAWPLAPHSCGSTPLP